MLEEKCKQIAQSQSTERRGFSGQQWQALIVLHETLLEEYHDFFMTSLHPSADEALRKSLEQHQVPIRVWHYGIRIRLKSLFCQLPESLEYTMKFIHLAYSMLILFLETVPAFKETWVEYLGALSRQAVAIQRKGLLDVQIWTRIARQWYNKASTKNPGIGRIQYNLGVVAKTRHCSIAVLLHQISGLFASRPTSQGKHPEPLSPSAAGSKGTQGS